MCRRWQIDQDDIDLGEMKLSANVTSHSLSGVEATGHAAASSVDLPHEILMSIGEELVSHPTIAWGGHFGSFVARSFRSNRRWKQQWLFEQARL